jgi:hypothetical protein
MDQTPARILMLLLSLGVSVRAQPAKVVSVFKVSFNEPELNDPPHRKDLTFGKPLLLSLSASTKVPRTFHARFFRNSIGELLASALARKDSEGCVWFDTQVIRVRVGAAMSFEPLSESWLYPSGIHLTPQDYTVVFEAGDQPTEQFIRLSYDDLSGTYLANAIQIRLNPGTSINVPAEVIAQVQRKLEETAEQVAQRTRETEQVHRSPPPAHQPPLQRPAVSPCWSARPLRQASTNEGSVVQTATMMVQSCQDTEVLAR